MPWRVAKSLEVLRDQVNAASPNRSKISDGTIGDAAHASKSSDHNPHIMDGDTGVVTAIDITHDPEHGVDIQKLADALVASRDSRIKYIIANGKIVSGSGQSKPAWQWRPYGGSNKHSRHVHISVKSVKSKYDDRRPWKFDAAAISDVTPDDSVLRKGSSGPFVSELQANLRKLGYSIKVDGEFGTNTEAAVKRFQERAGLTVDGWAGPRTINAIGEAVAEMAAEPKIRDAAASVPETADDEVKKSTGLGAWIMGVLGSGGAGISALFSANWETVIAVAGVTIAALVLLYIGRRRIIAAYKEINAEVAK